jgi:hypothetical protein
VAAAVGLTLFVVYWRSNGDQELQARFLLGLVVSAVAFGVSFLAAASVFCVLKLLKATPGD